MSSVNAIPDLTATDAAGPEPAAHAAAPPESAPQDTVTLSVAAEAQELYQDGVSATEIANTLGESLATVDLYLGLTPADAATAAEATPAATASAPAAAAPQTAPPAAATHASTVASGG